MRRWLPTARTTSPRPRPTGRGSPISPSSGAVRAQGLSLADLDFFDGCLASRSIGTRPTAELANESLSRARATLGAGEHPVLHGDRGAHYRWPGWIEICGRHGVSRSVSRKARRRTMRRWRVLRHAKAGVIPSQGLTGRDGGAVHGEAGRVVGRL